MKLITLQKSLFLLSALLCLSPAFPETVAFSGATIFPVSAPPVTDGVLLIEDGRISRVGSRDEVRIPGGARTIDVSGRVIIPGLVDTHSHVGEVAGADASEPIQPGVRVLDSINVREAGFRRARAGGLTSLNIMPGSGHLISGQTIYVKLRDGETIEELAYRRDDGEIAGGLKMANGTNPLDEQPFPGTRAKSAALVRQAYIGAQAYRDKLAGSDADEEGRPDRDLGKEALVEVLEGKRVVHHHTHRHDDIVTALRLQEEFGYRMVLQHVSEAWKVADEIEAANVPVSLILVDSPGGKLETMDLEYQSPELMEELGIETAFHTDDYVTDSRFFLRMGAFGVRAGMSRDAALEALTLAGARMLDIDGRTGSLERGKDADFVILSGDPFSVYTRVLETWVEGERVFDLEDPEDAAVAEGGFGALDAYNAREALVGWLRDFGVTTIHTGHAPGEIISGQTLVAKTSGDTVGDAVIVPAKMIAATLGESAFPDPNGQRKSPGTRGKAAAMLRSELAAAQSYLDDIEAAGEDEEVERPERNLRKEALAAVLDGSMPLLVTANRHHDIMTALRIAAEFDIRIVLDGAAESYLLIDEIRDAGVPVILHPTMARAYGERENMSLATAAELVTAGIPVAMQSGYETYVPKTRVVLFEAAQALAYGLTFDQALEMITIEAARILGIEDRLGSIEAGKDGDLAMFDGDPFEYTSHVTGTIINGELVSDTAR